jgi:phage terminase small subunit
VQEPTTDERLLNEDETAWIIRTTLFPHHRIDPNVLGFISNYMMCRNAKQSARELGLDPKIGQQLLRKSDVHECISRLTQKMLMKHGFDGSEVIERVKEVADINMADIFNSDGTFKKIHEIPAEVQRAFKKFKVKNSWSTDPNGQKFIDGEILEVEFWDKMKAVELLGREKDLFKEKKIMEHDIGKNMSQILLDSTKRASERLLSMAKDVTPQLTHEDDE